MVEGSPQPTFGWYSLCPLSKANTTLSKFASQYHQCLSGAEPSSSLCRVKIFPGWCTTGRHGCVVQKSASFRITSFGQASATVFCPDFATRKSIPRKAMKASAFLKSPRWNAAIKRAPVKNPMPSTFRQRFN